MATIVKLLLKDGKPVHQFKNAKDRYAINVGDEAFEAHQGSGSTFSEQGYEVVDLHYEGDFGKSFYSIDRATPPEPELVDGRWVLNWVGIPNVERAKEVKTFELNEWWDNHEPVQVNGYSLSIAADKINGAEAGAALALVTQTDAQLVDSSERTISVPLADIPALLVQFKTAYAPISKQWDLLSDAIENASTLEELEAIEIRDLTTEEWEAIKPDTTQAAPEAPAPIAEPEPEPEIVESTLETLAAALASNPDAIVTVEKYDGGVYWNPVDGAEKFEISYRIDGGEWQPRIDCGDNNFYLPDTLPNGTIEFAVCATVPGKPEIWSQDITV